MLKGGHILTNLNGPLSFPDLRQWEAIKFYTRILISDFLDRCETGIPGFDGLVEGGFPLGSMVLLTGSPGTGKTIFGLEYIYNGAMKGESGIYICIEASPQTLKTQAARFGMDFDRLEREGKVVFFYVPAGDRRFTIFKRIAADAEKINAKRIVFDSLATLSILLTGFVSLWDYEGNRVNEVPASNLNTNDRMVIANSVIEQLRPIGATTILITYGNDNPETMTYDKASEFLCDGIIELYNLPIGIRYSRSLRVGKMRSTANSQYIHEFQITDNGLVVNPADKAIFDE